MPPLHALQTAADADNGQVIRAGLFLATVVFSFVYDNYYSIIE
jgi:hypothetical protein